MKDVAAWQRDFFAAPSVWVVEDPDGFMSHVYDSKEAAMLETAHNGRGYRIREVHIHSLDLARRRWSTEP